MYIDGIFALSANLLISSTIKFNFKITDKSIITPAVIAIKFANSGLSFFMNKQSQNSSTMINNTQQSMNSSAQQQSNMQSNANSQSAMSSAQIDSNIESYKKAQQNVNQNSMQ